jgi:hypothetical protein
MLPDAGTGSKLSATNPINLIIPPRAAKTVETRLLEKYSTMPSSKLAF